MKRARIAIPVVIASASLGLFLLAGCGKNNTSPESSGAPSGSAVMTPATKNSFAEVTSRLDAGGNLYLYLGTAQWLDGLSQKAGSWRDTIQSLPGVEGSDKQNITAIFDLTTNLIRQSGIEDVSGFGMSSIETEKNFYRTKMFLHHYSGHGNGLLWTAFGAEPHALDGLDLLPASTVFASFGDLNLAQVWSTMEQDLSQSGITGAGQVVATIRESFQDGTGLKLDETLASLGGEYGVVITLNDAKKISFPTGQDKSVQFPEPGILIAIKVKNDLIFDRVDALLKGGKLPVAQTDHDGLKMRTVSIPLPLPIELKPSIARSGDFLFLASSDSLIEQVVAVQAGKQPGLKSTDEFKTLTRGIPMQANRFAYVSKRFSETWLNVQEQMTDGSQSDPTARELMHKLTAMNPPGFAFTVAANTPEGWLMTGNGSEDTAKLAILPVIVVPAVVAGVALPAFAKAKAKAQSAMHNSGQNN